MNDFMNSIKNDRVKQGTWKKIENHKKYAIWLGETLRYENMEDWYKITNDLINKKYGSGLIKCYNGSPSLFLKSVFPEYNWLEWKFTQTSQHFWKDIENHKKYAIWLGETLGYKNMEDWYKITCEQIYNNYGGGLVRGYYKGSPYLFLKSVFPEYNWLGWKFSVSPYNFWNFETEKQYAIWLGETLGYKNMEDWYGISRKLIIDNFGGGYILAKYNGSPSLFIKSVFPQYNWLEWKFSVTTDFWEHVENHKKYAIWLGETLGYKNMEDWYKITSDVISNNYGSTPLINHYNGSPSLFLKSVFPQYNWLEWKFTQTSQHFWKDIENHKKYAIWLGETLGYKNMEDWYKITCDLIHANFGGGLVGKYYNDSPCLFLKSVFLEYNWLGWKFTRSGQHFWKDMENHKKYAIWLGETLGYKNMEDWYKIIRNQIYNNYGSGLLSQYYNSSPCLFIKSVFPNYEWIKSKFKHNYSIGQIEWLEYIKVFTPDIIHALNNESGEFKIPNSNYSADGYSENKNCIYEYHGDFWHGNISIYNPKDINPCTKTSYEQLYNNTLNKQIFCEKEGFTYKYIWESEWIRGKSAVIILQKKYMQRFK
jgi:aromatic ring-cleaving dioxygenase